MKRACSLLLALGVLAACESAPPDDSSSAEEDARATVDEAPVQVAEVRSGPLQRTLEVGGVAAAWRSARLAPVGQGVVTKLPVQLGQEVKKGELLAQLDNSTLVLQADQASKAIRLAQLQFEDAQRQAQRAEELAAQGAMPTAQVEQARTGLQLAQAQLDQAEASLAVVQDQVGKSRLTAPFAGTVTFVGLEQGEFFSAMGGLGGPPALVGLDALDPIRLDVRVPDVDLARIREGMQADVVSDALPDRAFSGEVTLINAAAEPGTRTFLVRVRIPNADRALRPGLFLTARLVLDRRDDVLTVPERAVSDADSEPWVMVVDGSVARRKPVTLGLRGDVGWEVQGLQPGERVITSGQFGLPDGSAVRIIGG